MLVSFWFSCSIFSPSYLAFLFFLWVSCVYTPMCLIDPLLASLLWVFANNYSPYTISEEGTTSRFCFKCVNWKGIPLFAYIFCEPDHGYWFSLMYVLYFCTVFLLNKEIKLELTVLCTRVYGDWTLREKFLSKLNKGFGLGL